MGEHSATTDATTAWEQGWPVFSTLDRGNDVVAETSIPPARRMPAELRGWSVAAVIFWVAATALFGIALFGAIGRGFEFSLWWLILLTSLLMLIAFFLAGAVFDVARDVYGQVRAASRLTESVILLGAGLGGLVGAAVLFGLTPADPDAGLAGSDGDLAVVVPGLLGVVGLVASGLCRLRASRRIRNVLDRRDRIRALRESGVPVPGRLLRTTFLNRWSDGRPRFDVVVEFTVDGHTHVVSAHLITRPNRVPLPGTPLTVTRHPNPGPDPDLLIELDESTARFDSRSSAYSQPSN